MSEKEIDKDENPRKDWAAEPSERRLKNLVLEVLASKLNIDDHEDKKAWRDLEDDLAWVRRRRKTLESLMEKAWGALIVVIVTAAATFVFSHMGK